MKTKSLLPLLIILLLALTLVACGGGSEEADPAPASGDVTGNAAAGEALYMQPVIGKNSAPGCNTCHSLEAGVTLVGPSHASMGTRAASAVAGKSAEEFLHESIVDPNAVITDGFTAGVMYPAFGTDLSAQEIADLVAFLMTQK